MNLIKQMKCLLCKTNLKAWIQDLTYKLRIDTIKAIKKKARIHAYFAQLFILLSKVNITDSKKKNRQSSSHIKNAIIVTAYKNNYIFQ
jgi:hypothetical protein